jgi:hypothetical protein
MHHEKGDTTMTVRKERAKLQHELKRVKEAQEEIVKALLKNRVP